MSREWWVKLLVYCSSAIPVLPPALKSGTKSPSSSSATVAHQLLLFSHKSLGGIVPLEWTEWNIVLSLQSSCSVHFCSLLLLLHKKRNKQKKTTNGNQRKPCHVDLSRTGIGEPENEVLHTQTSSSPASHTSSQLCTHTHRSNTSVPYCFVTAQSHCGGSGRHRELCAEVTRLWARVAPWL